MTRLEEQRLARYFDGELPESEAREVAAWIERDTVARARLAELQALRGDLRQTAPDADAVDAEAAWQSVRSNLGETTASAPRASFGLPRWAIGAAAAILGGIAVAALVLPNLPKSDTADAPAVQILESDLELEGSMVYVDPESGWQIVWVIEKDPA